MKRDILLSGTQEYGIELSEQAVDRFITYHEFLEDKNRVMNLTAITDARETAQLHFLDSLALLKLTSFKNKSVIDIGSGAGFPGIPLKLAETSIALTILDAQNKRINFLNDLCRKLNLTDVVCLHARAEEASINPQFRDNYEYAVSRAVARLNILCELCLPFVKPGGMFIAMKGTDSDEEIEQAHNAVIKLGARIEKSVNYEIPGTGISHRAVIIRKEMATPVGYPRRFAKIQKTPL